jgi:acyl-CoA synthetase (AMP-forming)/AMP-acid ligase II
VLSAVANPQTECGVDGARAVSLCSGFFRWVAEAPARHALEIDDRSWTYEELGRRARAIAAALVENRPDARVPLTAVFGHRSPTAFASVLAVLARGHGYVPLNPAFPPARNRAMLERAGCDAVIVHGHEVSPLVDEPPPDV